MRSAAARPPLRAGSLIWTQISWSDLPCQPISKGGQVPFRMARDPAGVEIGALVTDRATKAIEAEAIGPARHRGLVQAAILALPRPISDRMAVQAARMGQNPSQLGEQCLRALVLIDDGREALR